MPTQVTDTAGAAYGWCRERRPGTVERIWGIRAGIATLSRIGLIVAAMTFPVWAMSPLDFVKFGDIKFEYVMGIASVAAVVALVDGVVHRQFGYRTSPWLWGLGGLIMIGLLASLTATDTVGAVNGNPQRRDGFLMMLFNAVFFLTAYRIAQEQASARTGDIVARCLVVAAVPVWAYALVQAVGIDPYVWESFRGTGARAFSTMGNPIFLGAYSAMGVLVALGLWMRGSSWSRHLWLLAAGVGASVSVLTAARAAWIGLLVGIVALAAVSVRGEVLVRFLRGALVASLIGALLGGIVLAIAPRDRVATIQSTASSLSSPSGSRNSGRLAIWAISARMIADHPLLGVGPDQMGAHFDEYRTSEYDQAEGTDRMADKPHSSLLEWTVETGMVGGALFGALVAGILFVVGRMLVRDSPSRGHDWVMAGVWAAAISYAVQSVVTVTAIGVDGVWYVLLGLLAGWTVARSPGFPEASLSVPKADTGEPPSPHRARHIREQDILGASAQGGLTMCQNKRGREGWAGQSGFTLIELLVVIIIIAILAGIAIPTYLGTRMKAQDAAAVTLVRNALTVVMSANVDRNNFSAVTAGELSAIEPAIAWNAVSADLVTSSPATITNAVVSDAGAHAVDYYGQAQDRFDVASVSESGNKFGIEVVSTGAAGASYVKVRVIEGDILVGW